MMDERPQFTMKAILALARQAAKREEKSGEVEIIELTSGLTLPEEKEIMVECDKAYEEAICKGSTMMRVSYDEDSMEMKVQHVPEEEWKNE